MDKLADIITHFSQTLPLLNELEQTPQDPEWHAEGNVATHTQMVMDAASKETQNKHHLYILNYAAAFHDIAKPTTTRQREINGKTRTVSPRHAPIGRSYLATHLSGSTIINPNDLNTIIALVGHHHDPRKLVADNSPRAKYARLARICNVPLLYHLCRADMLGRTCADQESQIDQVELFKLQAQEWQCWDTNPHTGWNTAIQEAFPRHPDLFHQHALAKSILDYEEGIIQSIHEAIPRAYNLPKKTYTTTLLCGPSGSGKSSWIEKHRTNETIISLDEIRKKITGKRDDQSKNGQVMQAAKEALKQALRDKKDIIWDATNTREDGRSWVVNLAQDYGAQTKIITIQAPINELIKRNKKREHPIPQKALMHQIERMEWPRLDEAHHVKIHQ